jgi:hypothetical protein
MARKFAACFSQRVTILRKCLIWLKKRSMRLRAPYQDPFHQDWSRVVVVFLAEIPSPAQGVLDGTKTRLPGRPRNQYGDDGDQKDRRNNLAQRLVSISKQTLLTIVSFSGQRRRTARGG